MHKTAFIDHLHQSNREGSGKASSYVRAMDLLAEMLKVKDYGFRDCLDLWSVDSLERLEELRELVSEQTREWESSPWNRPELPKSYLRDGYCRAALRAYQEFLIEHAHEGEIQKVFEAYGDDVDALKKRLQRPIQIPDFILESWTKQEGKMIRREVEFRINQNIFRKMILEIYQDQCCLTELNLPEVNRASHILSWANSPKTRMDPRNGLCLSATYDAAFDRKLISFDEDYRLILSKSIKDRIPSPSLQKWFLEREGQKMSLPTRFHPSTEYLAEHRKAGDF
ncbi:MAG: HNH endonuclease [Opitutales bacterium]|nr:HNH endonuclease [Opitutales bacterium]